MEETDIFWRGNGMRMIALLKENCSGLQEQGNDSSAPGSPWSMWEGGLIQAVAPGCFQPQYYIDFNQEPWRNQLQLEGMKQLCGSMGEGGCDEMGPHFCKLAKERGEKEYNRNFLKLGTQLNPI